MDETTKLDMLERCNAIDRDGLTYKQHDVEVQNSKYFDITPLKTAYEDYRRIYTEWKEAGKSAPGKAAVIAAWMSVGMKQRDLPVHYVKEYFSPGNNLYPPLPVPGEQILHPDVRYYSLTLSSLFLTGSSGLGITWALARGTEKGSVGRGLLGLDASSIDLAAITLLDEMRTDDREQSRENLNQHARGNEVDNRYSR